MKKTIILLLISVLFISFFFGGCAIKSNDENTSLIISDDSGKAGSIPDGIVVKEANKFVFNLEANATTGYTWIVDIEDEELISLVSNEYTMDDDTVGYLAYAQDWDGGERIKKRQ